MGGRSCNVCPEEIPGQFCEKNGACALRLHGECVFCAMRSPSSCLRRYRLWLGFFIFGLVVSGITAFPLMQELNWLVSLKVTPGKVPAPGSMDEWLVTVRDGLQFTYGRYPWLGYGTDWLAFGHLMIAVFFIGPFRDPVRNVWVLHAGLIACVLVVPLALICGPVRGIPVGWRLIDCSFGVAGAIPLLYCLKLTRRMEAEQASSLS